MPTIEDLQQEVQQLRAELALIRTPTPSAGEPSITLQPRGTGDPLLLGQVNTAGLDVTSVESPFTVNGDATFGTVVVTGLNAGWETNSAMTISANTAGVHPEPQNALVVSSAGGTAISVTADDGVAWMDPETVIGTGVTVATQQGTSLVATTQTGQALTAETTDATASKDAVTVTYAGTSRALYAESTAATNVNGTITGVNDGAGIGVWGEHKNPAKAGIGVVGVGDTLGRGGQFTGGAANVHLVPGSAATHPTTGKAGDLYVDHGARLWYCQKASTVSTPAVWKQLA
jgi:hypothetical protein